MTKIRTRISIFLFCCFAVAIFLVTNVDDFFNTSQKEERAEKEIHTVAEVKKVEFEEFSQSGRFSSSDVNEQTLILQQDENVVLDLRPEIRENIDKELQESKLKLEQEQLAAKKAEEERIALEAKKAEEEKIRKAEEEKRTLEAKRKGELPVPTVEVGTMKIISSTKSKNNSGSVNHDGMSVTINPNVVPYGTIVWIEGLGFRYNHPSDMGSSDNSINVYFKAKSEANEWNNKDAKVYIVKNPKQIDVSKNAVVSFKNLSTYKLTAYDPDEACVGQYAGPYLNKTGSIGAYLYEGVTVATDPSNIPYGSVIYIEGLGIRFVADTGGGVKNKHIDVYMREHQSALDFGVKNKTVYLIQQK